MRNTLLFMSLLVLVCCTEKKRLLPVINSQNITSPAGVNSEEPYLFSTQEGDIYLSWIEKRDTLSTLFHSKLNQQQWTSPTKIASGGDWFVNWADYPQLSKNESNYIAHYLQKSGQGTYAYDVMITQSANGIDWSEGKVLNEDGLEAEHGFVSILPFQNDFLLAWLDGRNTGNNADAHAHEHTGGAAMTLRAAIVDPDGNKQEEWELDNRVCDCCQTGAVMTSNGPIVVYRDRSKDEIRDISIVRLVDGLWTTPKTIYDDAWKINGCPVNGPRADAFGNTLAIAWFTAANNTPKVKVIFSKDGGINFSEPIELASDSTIGRVDVVMKDEKTAIVSWMKGADIKITKVDINGDVGMTTSIATSSAARSSGFPQMAFDGQDFIFAWTNDSLKTVLTSRVNLSEN